MNTYYLRLSLHCMKSFTSFSGSAQSSTALDLEKRLISACGSITEVFSKFFFREREAICLSMTDKSKQFHFHVNESYFMHYIQNKTLLTYLLCHHDPGKIQCEHSSL